MIQLRGGPKKLQLFIAISLSVCLLSFSPQLDELMKNKMSSVIWDQFVIQKSLKRYHSDSTSSQLLGTNGTYSVEFVHTVY